MQTSQHQFHQQHLDCGDQKQPSSVASFAARLLSLSSHELDCLHEDGELMRRFSDAHLHMESRLQTNQNKLYLQQNYYDLYCRSQQQHQQQQALLAWRHRQQQVEHQLVLDLSASAAAAAAAAASPQAATAPLRPQHQNSAPARPFNPKKMKLCEYQQELQLAAATTSSPKPRAATPSRAQPTTPAATTTNAGTTQPPKKQPKKYKGEFDEPTPAEVEQRQRQLASPRNYHRRIGHQQQQQHSLGDCACVLGSHFRDNRSASQMLDYIDQWRQLPAEERVQTKWDVVDLPLDIPLADIKKYEDLRREASQGRADFGGASKRKPLGIRGTRQFLLILYCLWGHPGRDDVMQREGYCPHCFAKIKKDNEQSTLVRVVNHFNMKHRRGANPRLSPSQQHRDTAGTPASNAPSARSATDTPTPAHSPSPAAIGAAGGET